MGAHREPSQHPSAGFPVPSHPLDQQRACGTGWMLGGRAWPVGDGGNDACDLRPSRPDPSAPPPLPWISSVHAAPDGLRRLEAVAALRQ